MRERLICNKKEYIFLWNWLQNDLRLLHVFSREWRTCTHFFFSNKSALPTKPLTDHSKFFATHITGHGSASELLLVHILSTIVFVSVQLKNPFRCGLQCSRIRQKKRLYFSAPRTDIVWTILLDFCRKGSSQTFNFYASLTAVSEHLLHIHAVVI